MFVKVFWYKGRCLFEVLRTLQSLFWIKTNIVGDDSHIYHRVIHHLQWLLPALPQMGHWPGSAIVMIGITSSSSQSSHGIFWISSSRVGWATGISWFANYALSHIESTIMMSRHGANPIFFNKEKIKIGHPEYSLLPFPTSDNISFLP